MAKKEYRYHIIHLVEKSTDGPIRIDLVDEKAEITILADYLNSKGKEGWHCRTESRHHSCLLIEKISGDKTEYKYQILHILLEKSGGVMLIDRVNEHKFNKGPRLLSDYLNMMGDHGYSLKMGIRHQPCVLLEKMEKERARYAFEVIHVILERTDGPIVVIRVNQTRARDLEDFFRWRKKELKKKEGAVLLHEYLNWKGQEGYYFKIELRQQSCIIIEKKID